MLHPFCGSSVVTYRKSLENVDLSPSCFSLYNFMKIFSKTGVFIQFSEFKKILTFKVVMNIRSTSRLLNVRLRPPRAREMLRMMESSDKHFTKYTIQLYL